MRTQQSDLTSEQGWEYNEPLTLADDIQPEPTYDMTSQSDMELITPPANTQLESEFVNEEVGVNGQYGQTSTEEEQHLGILNDVAVTSDVADINDVADDDDDILPAGPELIKKKRNLLEYFHHGDERQVLLAEDSPPPLHEYHALQLSVKEAIRTRGVLAEEVILKELGQMLERKFGHLLMERR